MTLIYKGVQNTIPNKNGVKTWHPKLVRTGKTAGLDEVSYLISKRASMHKSDVQAVLRSLTEVMNEVMMNSRSVRLDGFGTFTLIAKSKGEGVEKEEMVKETQITGLKCRFTPESTRNPFDGTTRALYEGVSFMHVNQLHISQTSANSNGNDDEDEYTDPVE